MNSLDRDHLADLQWVTPPGCLGRVAWVSYARLGSSVVYCRLVDRSSGRLKYLRGRAVDVVGPWDPAKVEPTLSCDWDQVGGWAPTR